MQHRSTSSASCPLDEVLITDELRSRPARRNFAAENRALSVLANALAEPPEAVLPTLTALALKLCHADSAGISLLDPGPPEVFRCTAVVGAAQKLHGSIPRHESPCGVVIERNDVLLFRGSERHFPLLRDSNPAIHECLLAPFDRDGRPQGTVWAVKHHPDGRFNAEDARLLKSLSRFASAAYGAAEARARAEHARDTAVALHPRLLQVSKMALIGEIASGVANELSQPLTAIGNYAQACRRLVSRLPADPERLGEALEEIAGQSQRAAETIEGLRRLVAAAGPERPESSLNDAVEEVLEVLRADARSRRVHIEVRLAAQLLPIRIERTQIQHVMLNLVRNALEVLESNPPDRREVVLETQTTAEGVELTISDNGPGLPEEARQRMFDPFFSTKAGGTGLGLPVSHSIVRAHGGRLIHERNAAGGARFRICLPASRD
ncbi:MAG TPA: ATP-binding protein [Steroidobacteraceae bacterium]|nr:ATP-binding protein [Steroidobacteraceae bacterium]